MSVETYKPGDRVVVMRTFGYDVHKQANIIEFRQGTIREKHEKLTEVYVVDFDNFIHTEYGDIREHDLILSHRIYQPT